MEDDQKKERERRKKKKFQSTSPGWRTTDLDNIIGEGITISIHVPRVEDDACTFSVLVGDKAFQSTSPGWRTT